MTFQPPPNPSSAVFVGIDPPTGWCIWTSEGIIGADQHDDIHKAKQAVDRCQGARRVHTSIVEAPFGGARNNNIREVLQNAMAAGWWMRHYHARSLVMWVPNASQWRAQLGIPADRKLAKEHALKMVDLICDVQGRPRLRGPKDGMREHASEAVLMCLSAWLKCGMVSQDDVAHRVIKTLAIPYQGGKPLSHSALTPSAPSSILSPVIERKRAMRASSWRGMMKAGGDEDGDNED